MGFVYDLMVLVHLLSMAVLVGGYLLTVRRPRPQGLMLWGGRLLLLTGVLIVGLGEGAGVWSDQDPNHIKIAIKLLVALVVVALIEISGARFRRQGESSGHGLTHAAGGLAIANVLVAVLVPGFV